MSIYKDLKILVVDDEKGVRDLLSRILVNGGYQVETACDGEEGLTACREENYALLLVDVHMPVKNGIEMVRDIRKEKPDQPVVFITTHTDKDPKLQISVEELNVFDCIYKPFDPERLIFIVETILESNFDKESGLEQKRSDEKKGLLTEKGETGSSKKANILVIDDEKGVRDLLSFELKRQGYKVATAVNGLEGVEKGERTEIRFSYK